LTPNVSKDSPLDKDSPDYYYDCGVIKYTINIPIPLYAKMSKKTGKHTKYRGIKSVYIRDLIERDVVNERPVTMKELLRRETRGQIYEPPKRYEGFLSSLRNSFRWRKFRKKLDRFQV